MADGIEILLVAIAIKPLQKVHDLVIWSVVTLSFSVAAKGMLKAD
jgi:hypothetical protein